MKTARIESKSFGKPTLFVDGEPMVPILYSLTHATGGRWSWEEVPARNIRNFYEAGIRLFQVDLYLEDIWAEGATELNLTKAVRQVQGVADMAPECGVVVRVHVNSPFWWNEQHRDECTGFAAGPIDDTIISGPPLNNESGDTKRALRPSMASEIWAAMVKERLIEFCQRFGAMPESANVIGLHICAGIFGEWHYWGMHEDPDTGPAMSRHFRKWLADKYGSDHALQEAWSREDVSLATAQVPGRGLRDATAEGVLRDPIKEREVIDYFMCQHEILAKRIVDFCQVAKENWPREAIVGVFYGYHFNLFNQEDTGGHLEIQRILECPYIDYLSSPQCQWYETQQPGGAGHSRGLVDSARIHGKLWFDELDHGARQPDYATKKTQSSVEFKVDRPYQSLLRRSTVHPFCRGMGAWYYDFGINKSRGWWDHPAHLKSIHTELEFFQKCHQPPFENPADVLVVHSAKAYYYMRPRLSDLSHNLVTRLTERLYHTGAIADHIYDFDLPLVNLDSYRAVVFINTFTVEAEQRTWIRDHVCRDNRLIIWHSLPGYCDGRRTGADLAADLTGLPLERADEPIQPSFCLPAFLGHPLGTEDTRINEPHLKITHPQAPLLTCKRTGDCLGSLHSLAGHQSAFLAVPVLVPAFYTHLFRHSGVHLYNTSGDALGGGNGLVWMHSVFGGERLLRLRNGKELTVVLPPNSTEVFDARSGERLLL
jgi:hypothetical protein